jgi:signal transduction histidine kinase
MDALSALQNNPTLKEVPIEQLEWLLARGEVIEYGEGDTLFEPGALIEYMFINLKGVVQIYNFQAGQRRDVFVIEPNDITGALPYSRGRTANAFAAAIEPCIIFRLHRDLFPEMTRLHYELTSVLVHEMTDRVREMGKIQQLNEKMMSLGKLSAGLAHELNNPASAIVRSSSALKTHLAHTPDKFKKVMAIEATDRQVDEVNQVMFERIQAGQNHSFSLMERSKLEDELLDWLEDHGVGDAFDLAPVLMEFGFKPSHLEQLEQILQGKHLDPVIHWICNNLVTEKIVTEIQEASQRIGHLVDSIKSYTHMDRGNTKSLVHIEEGLRNTLVLLNHKLKEKNIELRFHIPEDLPEISIFVGELNQVWTNLIDNAIDAMSHSGVLEIVCSVNHKWLKTSIIDNGTGIPPEIIETIFDPFVTTKEIGKGTGLGLDIVRKIISAHQGEITVQSKPGRTEFVVCLPLEG